MPSAETFEALSSDEFSVGLAFGFAALAIGALAVYFWRQWREEPAQIIALLIVVATGAATQMALDVPTDVWPGLVLLAVGGALYPWATRVRLLPAALAIPGAWWMTQAVDLPGAGWVPWLLLAWIVVGSASVANFDRFYSATSYGSVLLLISVAGIFVTLPDTEQILVLFGAAVPLLFLSWPRASTALGAVGVYPLLGMLAWVIAVGGQGRASSVIGATAALGLLAMEPAVRLWRRQGLPNTTPARWWHLPFVASMHFVLVAIVTRVAGTAETAIAASLISLAVVVALGLVLTVAVDHMPSQSGDAPARSCGDSPT